MSFNSIARAAEDAQLNERVQAAVTREALNNPQFGDSDYGRTVLSGYANFTAMYWAVANDTEAAYETALVAGRGCPGHDVDIITDAQITAAVQAHWPPDVEPPTPVVMPEPEQSFPPADPSALATLPGGPTTIVVDMEPEERNP